MLTFKEVNFILIYVTFVMVAAEDYPAALYDRSYESFLESGGRRTGELEDRSVSMNAVRGLVNEFGNRMLKRGPCLGAGMSHNCEFNDLNEALKHVQQISSGHFPGRRKRAFLTGKIINSS